MHRIFLASVVIILTVPNPIKFQAQSSVPPIGTLEFEVASIKPNKSGQRNSSGGMSPGGRFTATNATVFQIVRNAYLLQDSQVVGGPSWIRSERFDIVAKAADPTATQRQVPGLLQALLADRFRLTVHHETRERQEGVLVMARPDRRLGPRLRPASAEDRDCSGAFTPSPDFKVPPPCGMRLSVGFLSARGATIDQFTGSLRSVIPIIRNETDLEGAFNIDLEWTPDQMSVSAANGETAAALPSPPSDAPSIFTALQEQLGLKLELRKGPVEVIVIDSVERPTPD